MVRGVRVEPVEELRRRDVVVNEHPLRRKRGEAVVGVVAEAEVEEQEVLGRGHAEEAAVREHLGRDLGLGLDGERLRRVAPRPREVADREEVIARRVVCREGGMKLVDRSRGQSGLRPITA